MTDTTQPRPPGLLAGSAGASLGIILALGTSGAIEPPALYVLLVLPVALSVMTIARSVRYWQEQKGQVYTGRSSAQRRYLLRFTLASGLYMVGMGIAIAVHDDVSDPVLLGLLALLPALPAVAMALTFRTYLSTETDEYLRHRLTQSALGGLWAVLVLGVIYGFIETFAPVPHIPVWWVLPVWAVGMGLSQARLARDTADEDEA